MAIIAMETIWFYPWLVWAGTWSLFSETRPILHFGSVIGVLSLALWLTRRLVQSQWPLWVAKVVIIGVGFLVLAGVQHMEYGAWKELMPNPSALSGMRVLSLPALIYLWWRGILLGRGPHATYNIQRAFAGGLTALIGLSVLRRIGSAASIPAHTSSQDGFYIMAFFFCGLLAMTLNHLHRVRTVMQVHDAAQHSIRRWLAIITGVIGGMVALVFTVAAVLFDDVPTAAVRLLANGWQWCVQVLVYLLAPVFYVFDGLFWMVRFLIGWLRGDSPEQRQEGGPLSMQEVFGDVAAKALPPEWMLILKWTLALAVALVLLWILARAIARFRTGREEEPIEEIHESLWKWKDVKADLRSLLTRFTAQLRPRRTPRAAVSGFDLSLRRLDIREIFRRLQYEAARRGAARHSHETAREFGQRLSDAWSGSREIMAGLTRHYHAVRYGEATPPESEIERANRHWQMLQRLLQTSDAAEQTSERGEED